MAPPNISPPPRSRRRVPWAIVGLLLTVAVFALGVVNLFQLRFDVGDVYPPYSTLRSDPLGAKVLEAGLAALPSLKVERNLRPLAALGREPLRPVDADNGEGEITCFLLGLDAREWPCVFEPEAVDRLETIMRRGGRVVITFQPATAPPTFENLHTARALRAHAGPASLHGPSARRNALKLREPDLIARWGMDVQRRAARAVAQPSDAASGPALDRANPTSPTGDEHAAVVWHSALDFHLATVPAVLLRWRSLYVRNGQAVIVSRPFGDAGGQLILVGDSYFLSNEGLRDHPSPALIAALVGKGHHVMFDESHLGVGEHPGLVTLARRYRLQGAIAAFALLVALYIWRSVVSLVPVPASEADGGDTVAGQSAAAGYLSLLRRGIAPRDLPTVCVDRWEAGMKTAGRSAPGAEAARHRLREVIENEAARPARRRGSVASVYRALCVAAQRPKAGVAPDAPS